MGSSPTAGTKIKTQQPCEKQAQKRMVAEFFSAFIKWIKLDFKHKKTLCNYQSAHESAHEFC